MAACGEWAWYHPEKGLSRWYCGAARCHRSKCRTLFWSRRVRLLSALIDEFSLIRFFTLTLDPSMVVGDPWVYVHSPWVKMRHRLKRRRTDFKFAAVLERHKTRDVPHIHGFTNLWLPQRQWSHLWSECRGGKIVWVEKVADRDLSAYVSKELNVAKYVGKSNLVGVYKDRKVLRTLWRTRGLKAKFELQPRTEWCILKERMYKENGDLTDWATKEGVWAYGTNKCKRKDMAATRCAIPSNCSEEGIV